MTPRSEATEAARQIAKLSGLTIAAQIQDQAALTRAFEPVIKMFNMALQGGPAGNLEFRKLDGARPSYVLDLPAGLLPPPFATLFRPTIVMGKDQLIIGASTTAAEQAANLSGTPKERLWQPTGAFVPVVSKLPANMVYLRISDPRETLPAIIEALPILAQQVNAQIAQTQRMRAQFGGPQPAPGATGTPTMRVDANKLPRAEDLVRLLFPASTALVVDDLGASLTAREPIPGLSSPAVARRLIGFDGSGHGIGARGGPAFASASTTSSRSAWPTTTTTPPTTSSPCRPSPTRTASRS